MAEATLPGVAEAPAMKRRLRYQSRRVVADLVPHPEPNSWHVAIFRDRHLRSTTTPLSSANLPDLLRAAGIQPLQGSDWEATSWPVAERNPYREGDRLGVVYYVEAEVVGLIKIGTTTNLKARLVALQTSSPEKLRVLYTCTGGKFLESALHHRFWQYRDHGEWFHPAAEVLAFMEQEISDAEQLYKLHRLPWGPKEPPRWMAARDLFDREAERDQTSGFRSGSVIDKRS